MVLLSTLSCLLAPALFGPTLPQPLSPRRAKGGLTATFGLGGSSDGIKRKGCHRLGAPWSFASSRRSFVVRRVASGGRVAPLFGCTCFPPFTTTAGTPTGVHQHVLQPLLSSPVFGAKKSNRAVQLPFRPAGREGLGESGAKKSIDKKTAVTCAATMNEDPIWT
jgi:hypothetical protein